VADAIEVRGFMDLSALFAARGWTNPRRFEIEGSLTGLQLLTSLGLTRDQVESLIVNRRAMSVEEAIVQSGDRVAIVPPGAPGPHRVLLGLYDPSAPKKT